MKAKLGSKPDRFQVGWFIYINEVGLCCVLTTTMHRSVFAAWALALCASGADAFSAMPSGTPARLSLRNAATAPLAKKHVHAPGCACVACGTPSRFSTKRAQLSMGMERGADTGAVTEALTGLSLLWTPSR